MTIQSVAGPLLQHLEAHLILASPRTLTKSQVTNSDAKMPTSDKIRETAKQEVERVRDIASEGVQSGAYLYPLKVGVLSDACAKAKG